MLDINRDKEYLSALKFQLILCVLHLCGYSLVTQFRAFSLFVCFKGAVLVFSLKFFALLNALLNTLGS